MTDDPAAPGSDTTASQPEEGPGRAFAALMSSAASAAAPEAPYGWTRDRASGELRPKKTAGRPRLSPSLDELKAAAAGQDPDGGTEPQRDRPPGPGRRRGGDGPGADPDPEPPQYVPGQITRGMNRLYRRAGKIAKAMDPPIGTAIIAATRNTDEDGGDDSIGAAWEEVARTNPRIRRLLLKMMAGGAWSQLLIAHAPIFLAIIMKDGIRKHIPFLSLLEAVMEPDETATAAEKAAAPTVADIRDLAAVAQDLMASIGRRVPAEDREAA